MPTTGGAGPTRPCRDRVRPRADARPHHPHRPTCRARRSETRQHRRRLRRDRRYRRHGLAGAGAGVRQLDGARRAAGPAGDPPAAARRSARRPVHPHPGAGDASSGPRAADPDGRLARRHADPVRRARRALRPRHRAATASSTSSGGPTAPASPRAAAIVTWAEWTKAGLVDRYEVPADKIVVIPPGVDYERWAAIGAATIEPAERTRSASCSSAATSSARAGSSCSTPLRRLRADGVDVELDLVTRDDGARSRRRACPPRARTEQPRADPLYHRADVFCLPTLGDCLPMVLSEAGAVGLPLVSTDVGAIGEIVRDGEHRAARARRRRRRARRRPAPARRRPRRCAGSSATRPGASSGREFDAATNAAPARRPARRRRQRPSVRHDGDRTGAADGVGHDPAGHRTRRSPRGRRPRADYLEMAAAFDADLLDHAAARRESRPARPARRPARRRATPCSPGPASAGASATRVVFTDGEQVGLPYAALTWLARRRPRHVMIGHLLSPRKKVARPPCPAAAAAHRRRRRLRVGAAAVRRRRSSATRPSVSCCTRSWSTPSSGDPTR